MKLIELSEIREGSLRQFLLNYDKKSIPKNRLTIEYLELFQQHWDTVLLSLEPLDLYLLMSVFLKDGVDIYQLTIGIEEETVKQSVERLEKLCLCTLRLNITHLKMISKLYMFEEIREFLSQEEKVKSFSSFEQALSKIDVLTSQILSSDIPDEIVHFFYSYGFYVPQNILEQSFVPDMLRYLQEGDFLKQTFLISTKNPLQPKSYLCYTLHFSTSGRKDYNIVQTRSFQTQVINDLARLVLQVQREGLKTTKKDEMSKKSLEKFYKIIPQESLLWFLLQFLKHKNYLEMVDHETYKVSENFLSFFKKSLIETYQELLKTDSVLQDIVNIVQGLPSSLVSFADIVLAYLKQQPQLLESYMDKRELRRSLLQKIELLHYLGLLDQSYTSQGLSFYSMSRFYKNSHNYHTLPKPILTLSTSFQLIGDMEQIPPQISYMLSLFGDIESLSPALVFKIDQGTFHRALYFGFGMHDLLDILNHYAKTPPDAFVVQSLELWTRNFKRGYLQEGVILYAPSEILDELEYKPEYSLYLKKRISAEYAIVSLELKAKKILEKSNIYFFLT